jgi:hypothetical protein
MSQRTRRRLLLGLPAATVAGFAITWWLWPRTAITRENAAKMREGMTLAQVEAILGGPARDESSGPLVPDLPEDATLEESGAAHRFLRTKGWSHLNQVWTSDRLMIRVDFDPDWRVVSFASRPVRRFQESPLDILRRWLGL